MFQTVSLSIISSLALEQSINRVDQFQQSNSKHVFLFVKFNFL